MMKGNPKDTLAAKVRNNASRAKIELEAEVRPTVFNSSLSLCESSDDTPASDIFHKTNDISLQKSNNISLQKTNNMSLHNESKKSETEDKSLPHERRSNGKTKDGETQYVYQLRISEKNRFWLNTYAVRNDKTVYQVVQDVIHEMTPVLNSEKTMLTINDYKPLHGGKQLTIYLTETEINAIKDGAKKKGLKLIRYVDKLLNMYREKYDGEWDKIAYFESDNKD